MTEPTGPLVSVVVTTRNSARTLESCLRSIRAQTYEPLQLIVVDNASSDETVSTARRYADIVEQIGPERSAQRNHGVSLARGQLVLWIDSDMVLHPEALEAAVRLWARDTDSAVAIPERTVGDGFWTRCRALERACYVADPSLHNPRLIPIQLLHQAGGFQESMSGPEDTHLRHRLHERGVPIRLTPVLIDHDEGRLTLRDVVAKRVYYGSSLPAFRQANPRGLEHQARGTLRAFWRSRAMLARSPLHTGGMLLLRSVEAVAYGAGYLKGRTSVDASDPDG